MVNIHSFCCFQLALISSFLVVNTNSHMVPNIMIGITKTLVKGAADSEAAAKEMLVVNVLNDGVT